MSVRLAASAEAPTPTRVVAVTSGKGGVGKTTVSINTAVALQQAGHRVLLLDADLGLANVDVLLGLNPKQTLSDVINGDCTLQDIVIEGPSGISIIPAASGIQQMAELNNFERNGLIRAFSELEQSLDYMIVDTAAGIAANTLDFCAAAQEVLVVVCDNPASITDAYATIKVLNQTCGRDHFHVLVNMAQDKNTGLRIYKRLCEVADRYLNVGLNYAGQIPWSGGMAASQRRRSCIMECEPTGNSARAFKILAQTADRWPVPRNASGRIEFFVERMARSEFTGRVAQL